MTSQNKKALEAMKLLKHPQAIISMCHLAGCKTEKHSYCDCGIDTLITRQKHALDAISAALQPAPIDIEELKRETLDCNGFCGIDSAVSDQDILRIISDTIDYLSSRGLITQKVAAIPGLGEALWKCRDVKQNDWTLIYKAAEKYWRMMRRGDIND